MSGRVAALKWNTFKNSLLALLGWASILLNNKAMSNGFHVGR